MRRAPFVLLTVVALASCVPPARVEAPQPRLAPTPPPAPPPVALAPDWNDWPRTPGTWVYGRDAFSTRARFGSTGVAFSCDNDRRVRLTLDARTNLAPLTIRTTSMTRTITPTAAGHPPTGIAATFAAAEPLLDAIAFSRGRFTVEQPGMAPLVLTPYAEIGRVIEDCRR